MSEPWLHPDLEVRPSTIAGRGLFATRPLDAGTEVARPSGPVDEQGSLNHACDPNLGWDGDRLVTLRAIAVDEELVVDYALSVSDPNFILRCHCPSYRCRQMVEGRDWQIPVLQQRYAGSWHPDIKALIDSPA